MQKKTMIAFLLTLVMVFSIAAPAVSAVDATNPEIEGIEPRYTRVATFDIDLDIGSNDKSTSYSRVTSGYGKDTINLTMELQQKIDGKWETIKSWSGSGVITVSLEKDWYVDRGYDYQVLSTADVYNSSGVWQETVSETSFVVHH